MADHDYHVCKHSEEWKEYQKFREEMKKFIGAKESMNGATTREIERLRQMIQSLDSKIDKLIFTFATAFVSMVIVMISYVIRL